jgi:hypothetical protein
MPDLYDAWEKSTKRILTRFTGTPDKEYQVVEPGPSASDPPVELPDAVKKSRTVETSDDSSSVVTTTLTEAVRLAALVKQIDHDCAVAPYGAYLKVSAQAGWYPARVMRLRNVCGNGTVAPTAHPTRLWLWVCGRQSASSRGPTRACGLECGSEEVPRVRVGLSAVVSGPEGFPS